MGNLTVTSGRGLLDMLAEDSHEADEFRRFVLGQSTTYFGDSDDWCVQQKSDIAKVMFVLKMINKAPKNLTFITVWVCPCSTPRIASSLAG